MTKSQINRLGEKLRKTSELETETLVRLQEFRASYDKPMSEAQGLLRQMGLEATSRLKTTNTIIEKLRREKTRLSEMQDIGGIRVVLEGDLTRQNEIVKRIADAFPITRVIDRRRRPTHGYRAVHVIATLDERLLEIQVRTRLQDLWAQAMERLADGAGRQIRYGGAPQRRGEDVETLLNISREIGEIEDIFTKLNQLVAGWSPPRDMASMQREVRLYLAKLESFRQSLRGREREISVMLKALIASEESPT
jgi:ppGpp synthetase/RelA/SpoT-type nucleotidyltranferase